MIEFEKSTVYIIRTVLYMDFDCYITHTTPCFSSNVKYAHVISEIKTKFDYPSLKSTYSQPTFYNEREVIQICHQF
jgi:hypothetical protein